MKGENLLFLLGAGASFDAGIPISYQMVDEVESLIKEDPDWKQYQKLYFYLRSSIQYSEGIFGNFNEKFNIEKLLIVISEIEKRDKNLMYPFIGTWNTRLMDVAGENFQELTKFKKLIVTKLNEWVKLNNYDNANYYSGFTSLKNEIGNLLKVFTLNYDLCFERVVGRESTIEAGFNPGTRDWHYSNFDSIEGKDFFLYKMHGSINWYIQKQRVNKLFISDDPVELPKLIFGVQYKMTSEDPYFFYSSELRRLSLDPECKLMICVGYSFSDDYLNNILTQALTEKSEAKMIVVGPCDDKENEQTKLAQKLDISNKDSIIIEPIGAKEFLTNKISKDYLSQYINYPQDAPF